MRSRATDPKGGALLVVILLAAGLGCRNPTDTTQKASAPAFDPPGGTYGGDITVSLATATAGAVIRYTSDGSEPSAGSSLYSQPIAVSLSRTLKAVSCAPGYEDSSISSAAYIIDKSPGQLLPPTFSLPPGMYHRPIRVSISSTTSGASIRYTLDGSDPIASSPLYASPLSIAATMTLRAVTCREGWETSDTATALYGFSVALPVFSPPQGLYSALRVDVAISSDTPDAGIVYTVDGSDPSATHGLAYEGPIALTSITTLKAIALRAGWDDSKIAEAKLQPARLAPFDCSAGDGFGSSLSLSRDGSVLAVGTPSDDVGGYADQGSVRVYESIRDSWVERQRLVQSQNMSTVGFGSAIAVSSDGACIVVGAPWYRIGTENCGAAHVFTRSGTTWVQAQTLSLAVHASGDAFGGSVAVSDDGSVIAVGARGRAVGGKLQQGTAHIFVRSGGTWSESQEINSTDGAVEDFFGSSVDITADASEILVGAIRHTVGGNSWQGAVYSFVRSGGTWTQSQELTPIEGAATDQVGNSVSVSADGQVLAIGACETKVGADIQRGAVYVFARSGGTWTQSARLLATDGKAGDLFGYAVEIDDGNRLIGGAPWAAGSNSSFQGAAYLWTCSGGIWSDAGKFAASDGEAGDTFGGSVTVSFSTGEIIVGAPSDAIEGTAQQGSVHLFPLP